LKNEYRKSEEKIPFKIKNLSRYAEIKDSKDFYSEQACYINNLPFKALVRLCPSKETNEVALGIYINSKEINQLTLAE
jgi:hypothetical protein